MSDTLNLMRNENGDVVNVITSITQEPVLTADEYRAQIKQHTDVINKLQCGLEARLAFDNQNPLPTDEKDTTHHVEVDAMEVELPETPSNPIINQDVLVEIVDVTEETVGKVSEVNNEETVQ